MTAPRDPPSARNVAQAIDSLRRGWPVGIRGAGGVLRVLAIETADAVRLAAFDPEATAPVLLSSGRAVTLRLTNQRAAAAPDCPVLVARTPWLDFDVATALADPQFDLSMPMKGPFHAIELHDAPAARAALRLATLAGMLPAFFVVEGTQER